MQIQFLGAAHEVTGSCTLIKALEKNIIIDMGMEQGRDIYENCELPISPAQVDIVFLTHAHIDHSGKLPYLTAQGYNGPIYSTQATLKLCEIMLLDSAHIQESEAVWRNRKAKRTGAPEYVPLYTTKDAQKTLSQFVPCSYGEEYDVIDGLKVRFYDAGHLLGSSSIELIITENGETTKVVFSGDLGNVNRPLINDPNGPKEADYVIIESTYGDRTHGPRADYVGQLTRVLQETLDKGGNIVIPSFAVGRTQELLYLIRKIKDEKLVKCHDGFPVYVDSPMAASATQIYGGALKEYYDKETLELLSQGINPILFDDLVLAVSTEESIAINNDTTPKVILSASGMCEAGRIRHHLKHNLWRKESAVLFVGYQSEGTLGRRLLDGDKEIKLFSEPVTVNASIEEMDGISGHADMNILLSWLENYETKPKKVFINHGEDKVCDEFAKIIEEKLGFEAEAPYNGAVYDLKTGELLKEGERSYIAKKPRESTAFAALLSAGKELLSIIETYKNGANKDIKKFTNEIRTLIEKWKK